MKTQIATIKALIESSNLPESLVRAVVRQSGGWGAFTEHADDVTKHGADGGFSGFIYYADTLAFTKRNRPTIIEVCKAMADDFGQSGVVEFVKGFNCLKGATEEEIAVTLYGKPAGWDTNVANALAWFALEEVARAYADN